MTLNDIIVSALAQNDRGHDSQTLEIWRDKFKGYANEAVQDLATALGMRRSDTLVVEDGEINIDSLPYSCIKVLSVKQSGEAIAYGVGSSTGRLSVNAAGSVTVEYRYKPKDMTATTDKPGIPEFAHGLIVTYVVARERASQDASTQRGANVYFELYQAGRAGLKRGFGEPDAHKIINRW